MIISASRRTDIPASYAAWLCNRFQEGYAYVCNPMDMTRIRLCFMGRYRSWISSNRANVHPFAWNKEENHGLHDLR